MTFLLETSLRCPSYLGALASLWAFRTPAFPLKIYVLLHWLNNWQVRVCSLIISIYSFWFRFSGYSEYLLAAQWYFLVIPHSTNIYLFTTWLELDFKFPKIHYFIFFLRLVLLLFNFRVLLLHYKSVLDSCLSLCKTCPYTLIQMLYVFKVFFNFKMQWQSPCQVSMTFLITKLSFWLWAFSPWIGHRKAFSSWESIK